MLHSSQLNLCHVWFSLCSMCLIFWWPWLIINRWYITMYTQAENILNLKIIWLQTINHCKIHDILCYLHVALYIQVGFKRYGGVLTFELSKQSIRFSFIFSSYGFWWFIHKYIMEFTNSPCFDSRILIQRQIQGIYPHDILTLW